MGPVVKAAPSARELAFHAAMVDLYRRAKFEAGYPATYFLGMISDPDLGGLGTAKYLIHKNTPSDGYVALFELGRLDLTVEATVLLPEWADLFTDAERQIVRTRLTEYRFDVDGYLATHLDDQATSSTRGIGG